MLVGARLPDQPARTRGGSADPAFRDTLAEAVVVAVQRLYLGDEDDASTGTLNLRDVLANAGLT